MSVMAAANQIDILGLGAVAVDDGICVEGYPPPDTKTQVIGRERRFGGLTGIALVTAARLGARCAYAGTLGRDELSWFALESLKREKIDVSRVKRTASARPIHSNIVVDQRLGTRNIFFDLDHVLGASVHVPAALIRSSRVLFIDHVGVPGMIRAARLARHAGIPVVADFAIEHDPQFRQLFRLANHLILSQGFARRITGKRSPQRAVLALASSGH